MRFKIKTVPQKFVPCENSEIVVYFFSKYYIQIFENVGLTAVYNVQYLLYILF